MASPQELRERMLNAPFVPTSATPEIRHAAAIEYIALYLGEIEKHLGKIAASVERGSLSADDTAKLLRDVRDVIARNSTRP